MEIMGNGKRETKNPLVDEKTIEKLPFEPTYG